METETETIGNCRHRRRPRHHTHMALACIGLQRISKTASIVFTAHRTAGLIRRKRTMRHRPARHRAVCEKCGIAASVRVLHGAQVITNIHDDVGVGMPHVWH